MKKTSLIFAAYTLCAIPSFAQECGLRYAFEQPDEDGKRFAAVWDAGNKTPILFESNLQINSDGAKRSYSVEDFWGEKNALNNLCNAMKDKCADLSEAAKRQRRELTQYARIMGWPADLLAKTRVDSKIIPLTKMGVPCPEVEGFLVSATALSDPSVKDACDSSKYIDALAVSAIVLPGRIKETEPSGFEARNAKLGDLAVVIRRDTKMVAFAVVGDIGPKKNLGEGTIKLSGILLGKQGEPANRLEILGKKPFQGKSWPLKSVYTIIFPGSRDNVNPFITQKRIDDAAAHLFNKWGGMMMAESCIKKYMERDAKNRF